MANGRDRARGFAYVLVLVVLAIMALVAAAAVSMGATLARRSAEEQLLAVGSEMQSAIASYRAAGGAQGGAQGGGPKSLQDLLKDQRSVGIRRHLRKIYADPLTGKTDWGLLKAADGSIVAVYSLAEGLPIKQTQFGPDRVHFEHADSYAKWTFGPRAG